MAHGAFGLLYIEVRYLHKELLIHGYKTRRNDFVTRWYRVLSADMDVPVAHLVRASLGDGMLPFDALSASAFVALLVGLINAGPSFAPRCRGHVLTVLQSIAHIARGVHRPHPHGVRIEHDAIVFTLGLDGSGRITNWDAMLADVGLVNLWNDCRTFEHLGCLIDSDIVTPSLVDAITFAAIASATLPARSIGFLVMGKTLSSLSQLAGSLFQSHMMSIAATLNAAIVPRPPLIRGASRACLVDPHSAFNLLERARALKTVPREVLRFNNDRDEWLGLAHNPADGWWLRELDMYVRNAQDAMLGESQFSMAMDPSAYNGEETMVSQIYSAGRNVAVNAVIKIVPRGKHISVNEIPMTDRFAAVCIQRRQQRWAAYKEMRAVSAQISHLTRGRMSIDSFKLPGGFVARQLAAGQKRVVLNGIAMIANVVGGVASSAEPEMPISLAGSTLPLLVIAMDQGGIGSAGVYFAINSLSLMISPRWDRYHRGVNDMKAATQHALGGMFRRVILLTTFLFNINYGPFGKGAYFDEKKEMLKHFLASENHNGILFRKYADLYGASLGATLDTEDDYKALFDTLAELPSFTSKGPVVKLMRWYAWWTSFDWLDTPHGEKRQAEYYATKMIYEHHLQSTSGEVIHTDMAALLSDQTLSPQDQLRRLKQATGGFKLAHKIMTDDLYSNARVLYSIGQATWSEHVFNVEKVKTPQDGLRHDIELALGQWKDELKAIVEATFTNLTNLSYWRVLDASVHNKDAEKLCDNAAMLGLHLVCNRAYSSMVEYALPPLLYAPVLSDDRALRSQCLRRMKGDWSTLLQLELLSCTSPAAKLLLDDLYFAKSHPNRILFMLFERGRWSVDFQPALDFARAMFLVLPDSRLVEEHHGKLRDAARACKHNVTTRVARMQTVRNSQVLEARGIPTVTVTRDQYVEQCRRQPEITRGSFESASHHLRQDWEALKMPGARSWASPTPSSSRRALTAWHWCLNRGDRPVVAARCSSAFSSYVIVRRLSDRSTYFTLEAAKWGVLALSSRELVTDTLFTVTSNVEILHATALKDEFVIIPTSTCSPARLAAEYPQLPASLGITFRRTGPDISMLRFLMSRKITMSCDDLLQIVRELGLPHTQSMTKKELIALISKCVANDLPAVEQNDFLRTSEVFMNMPEDDADVHIDNDIEDVFDLIEPDNKEEFAEFGSSIKKRHLRNKIAAAKSVIAQAKVRSRPKAKAAAASVVELPVFVPPVAPEVGAIPVCRFLAVVPAAARVIEAPGLSWPWGSFVLGERLPTVDRPHGACWVRCKYHDTEPSRSGVSNLHCTKEWSLSAGLTKDECIQKLKWWSVSGSPADPCRKAHMKLGRAYHNLFPGQIVPTEGELLALRRPWDDLAVARGII